MTQKRFYFEKCNKNIRREKLFSLLTNIVPPADTLYVDRTNISSLRPPRLCSAVPPTWAYPYRAAQRLAGALVRGERLIIYNRPEAPAERRSHAPWNSASAVEGSPASDKKASTSCRASDTSQGGAFGRKRTRAPKYKRFGRGRPLKKTKPLPRKYSASPTMWSRPPPLISLPDRYIFSFVWHYSRLSVSETGEAITPGTECVYDMYYWSGSRDGCSKARPRSRKTFKPGWHPGEHQASPINQACPVVVIYFSRMFSTPVAPCIPLITQYRCFMILHDFFLGGIAVKSKSSTVNCPWNKACEQYYYATELIIKCWQ